MSIKGQVHSLALAKGHSDFKIKTCFSQKLLGHFNQISKTKAFGRMGIKKNHRTNELGHMTKMAAMPIYGKNLWKSSSAESVGR